jgi:transposase InsO family protein
VSKARLVITAVEIEGITQAEAARRYGVSPGWVSKLVARYRAEGDTALEPRSKAPKTSPHATPAATVELLVGLRKQLTEAGLDAGADTIDWHLRHRHGIELSRATINRILVRAGAVTPDPSKRPKSSYTRFEAEQPNETWQSDFTHYRLADPDSSAGGDVEVITWLDDHSRYALHISAHTRVTAPIVLAAFRAAADLHGYPASTLTDNGMVYTVRFAGGRGGRTQLEHELRRLGIVQKNSRPTTRPPAGRSRDSSRP